MRDPPVDDETSGGEEPGDAEDGCVSSRYDMQEMLAALTNVKDVLVYKKVLGAFRC